MGVALLQWELLHGVDAGRRPAAQGETHDDVVFLWDWSRSELHFMAVESAGRRRKCVGGGVWFAKSTKKWVSSDMLLMSTTTVATEVPLRVPAGLERVDLAHGSMNSYRI